MLTTEEFTLEELLEGKSHKTILKLCRPNPNLDVAKTYAESQETEDPRYNTSIEGYPDNWSLGYKMHAAHTRSLYPPELANPDIETHLDDIIVKPEHSKEYFTYRIDRLEKDEFISERTAADLTSHLDEPSTKKKVLKLWEDYKEEKLSKPEKRLQQLKEQQRKDRSQDWRQEPKARTQQRRQKLNPLPSAGDIPPLEAVIKRFRVRMDDGPYTQEEDFVREDVPF